MLLLQMTLQMQVVLASAGEAEHLEVAEGLLAWEDEVEVGRLVQVEEQVMEREEMLLSPRLLMAVVQA